LAEREKGRRAVVGAVGEAEEDGAPLALQQPFVDGAAGLVHELERSAHGGGLRLRGEDAGTDRETCQDGERKSEDGEDGEGSSAHALVLSASYPR
jgi:hypothetical protein